MRRTNKTKKMRDKSILLFQRILPSYRIPVFKKLHQNFNIIPCYSDAARRSSIQTRDDIIGFPAIKLNRIYYRKSDTSVVQNPIPVLIRYRPRIIICESALSYLTLWILLILKPFFRYKIVLWGHGIKYKEMDRPFRSRRSKILLKLFNVSDGVLLYSEKRSEVLKGFIKDSSKVFVARNTLDTDKLFEIYNMLDQRGRVKIKEELGYLSEFNLIYIGRLLRNKGLKEMIEAFKKLPEELDISLHIVGDGPEKGNLARQIAGFPKIKLYGAIYDPEQTGRMIFASDLMVMPGYVGLSVIHAFAFGCPVITFNSDGRSGPLHSPEVEYIIDNYNGVFVENSVESLANEIERIIRDRSKLKEMSQNALETAINRASIHKMLSGFKNVIEYLKSSDKSINK